MKHDHCSRTELSMPNTEHALNDVDRHRLVTDAVSAVDTPREPNHLIPSSAVIVSCFRMDSKNRTGAVVPGQVWIIAYRIPNG